MAATSPLLRRRTGGIAHLLWTPAIDTIPARLKPVLPTMLVSRYFHFVPILLAATLACHPACKANADDLHIVLVAGEVKQIDREGHHDYKGGVLLLRNLLEQNAGVKTSVVENGWPADESVFDGVDAVVFYTDGAGQQAYLQSPERIAVIQKLVDAKVGIVSIHQAVEFPPALAKQSMQWLGGLYHATLSGRGHWDSTHDSFPEHPVTRGVVAWEINDGWLNGFKFPAEMKGITPLVWSGKQHLGSPEGGPADVVAWTFDRADGGRSFNFSGLDAHSAWEHEGVRKLMVNGILWTTGFEIPEGGAKCAGDHQLVNAFVTPRTPPPAKQQPTQAPKEKAKAR